MKTALCIAFLMMSIANMQAQFTPDLIGFQYSEFERYKKMKIKEQIEKIFDAEFTQEYIVNSITSYSEKGQILQTVINPELNGEEALDTIQYVYEYNADGKILVLTVYGLDIVPMEYGFFYDKKGNLYESTIASAEARKIYYELDKKGSVVKAIAQGAVFEYDTDGNASENYTWEPTEETTYVWNDKGWLMEERSAYKTEFSYHALYMYDADGKLTEEKFCYDAEHPDTASTIITFEYDEKGLLKKRIVSVPHSDEKYETVFEYTFYN